MLYRGYIYIYIYIGLNIGKNIHFVKDNECVLIIN